MRSLPERTTPLVLGGELAVRRKALRTLQFLAHLTPRIPVVLGTALKRATSSLPACLPDYSARLVICKVVTQQDRWAIDMLPGMFSIKNARLVKSLEINKGTAGGTNSNLINFQLGFPGVALQTGEDLAASPSFSRAHSFLRCPRPLQGIAVEACLRYTVSASRR